LTLRPPFTTDILELRKCLMSFRKLRDYKEHKLDFSMKDEYLKST